MTLLLLMLVGALGAPFARSTDDDPPSLEVAARDYTHADGTRVTLISMVHVADAAFYTAVQEHAAASQVVLLEGVTGVEQSGDTSIDELYRWLARVLGLAYQGDALNVHQPGWRNSDRTLQEIEAEALSRGESASEITRLLTDGLPGLENVLALPPAVIDEMALGEKLRRDMVENTASRPVVSSSSSLDIGFRNEKVIADVMSLRGAEVTIAVLYGTRHQPDLERRLLEEGFTPSGEHWLTAVAGSPTPPEGRTRRRRSKRRGGSREDGDL